MSIPRLRDALADADLLFDREALETAITRMAVAIRADYGNAEDPHGESSKAGDADTDHADTDHADTSHADPRPVYLTVMHGGMPFAAQLAFELGALGLDLEFDYLHATRYRGATTGGELVWKHRPATSLRDRRVLLADDIFDEGHTMAAITAWCREQGAADVRIAALAVKLHDRCVPGLRADYVGIELPDRYVFGYGMDYHEQGRNLPAIYALKD